MTFTDEFIDDTVLQAAITIQWQATDVAGEGNSYPISERGDDFTAYVIATTSVRETVESFLESNEADIKALGLSPSDVGHNLVLSAEGHGAGFRDRGWGAVGDTLHANAKPFGSFDAEFALYGDYADGDETLSDEVAYLMVDNQVLVADKDFVRDVLQDEVN